MFSTNMNSPLSKIPVRRGDSSDISDNNRRWQSADCLTLNGKEQKVHFRSKIPGALQGRNPFKNLSKGSIARRLSLNLHSSHVNLVSHSELSEGEAQNVSVVKKSEKKALSDQQPNIKNVSDSFKKDKRSNDSATVDSHNFRNSPTDEVYRLKNCIEEQENEILSLQAKLDNKIETKPHDEFNKQSLLTKNGTDVDSFPAIFNHAKLPYDQSNSRGFSSLITINHQNTTEEMALRKQNLLLKNELQEAKDHMELLEFRILEYTEDQKEYLQEWHKSLKDICKLPEDKIISLYLQRFLELREHFKKYTELDLPDCLDIKRAMESPTNISEFLSTKHTSQITDSLSNKSQEREATLLEDQSDEVDILKKLDALRKENKELHDIIATLSESHETRTEASGTESEQQIHGKTPSISSDLSDAECDALPNIRDTKVGIPGISSSLQESGIFETQCDMTDATTQTIDGEQKINLAVGDENTPRIQTALESLLETEYFEDASDMEQISSEEYPKVEELKTQMSAENASAVKVQEWQECEEYILSDIDDRIILNKSEYDAIVAEERTLKAKIEELNAENDELTRKCVDTEAQLKIANAKTPTNDQTESMRGAVRVLEEQLLSAEKHSKQFFEEKCEYEEAENDARLMVQRLQSQLEATQEMEALLSASLSQEQEFSRDLQKILSNIQMEKKEDQVNEKNYLREIRNLLEKEKHFIAEVQFLKVHYFVLMFKFLVKEYFIKYGTSKKLEITYDAETSDGECDKEYSIEMFKLRRNFISQLKLISESPIYDCLVPNFHLINDVDCTAKEIQPDPNISNDELIHPKLYDVPMDCTDFSTEKLYGESHLSDRENFYLQQIEILQQEKKNLRNDFETNDGELYQQFVSCRNELDKTCAALENSETEKCKLIFKIEELQYDLQSAKNSSEMCVQNIRAEYSSICDSLRRDKRNVANHYESQLDDMEKLRRTREIKEDEMKRKLTCIHLELAPYIDDTIRGGSATSESDDIHYVSGLVKSEASLRDKIFELQEKERAYMETISEADKIMSAHVTSYNRRIKDLESQLNDKNPILTNVEERLESMKEKISAKSSCLESEELADFLSKLQLELRKLNFSLIKNVNDPNFIDLTDMQANDSEKSLDSEFHEKEDLLQKLLKLTTENSALSFQLQESHEAARKMSEMHQSEHYFRSRVEELESSEICLRGDLKKYETCIAQSERKYEEKVNSLKEEIRATKIEAEVAAKEKKQAKNNESSVKNDLVEMKNVIHSLKSELQESSDENEANNSQHRLEVARLRSQLSISNSQLIEFGGVNGELKEKLSSSERLLTELTKQIEETSKKYEADVLSFNLKLSQKESSIEDMEAHMQQLKHNEAVHELDDLASLPFSDLHKSLKEIYKSVQECSKCNEGLSPKISALMQHSETFSQLINGRTSSTDSEAEGEKSKHWILPKSSSDNENLILEEDMCCSMSQLADIYPCVPPRPRRDAKMKRKWNRSSDSEESILDELQATLKSGRKNVSGRSKAKEMKQNIKSLENKVKVREEELQLADLEVVGLYGKLASENESSQLKQIEISNLRNSMVTFRKEFLTTVEQNEKVRQDTVEKHKEEIEEMKIVTNDLEDQLSTLKHSIKERNHLLKSFVQIVKSKTCYKNLITVLSAMLNCAANPMINELDFTIENLYEDVKDLIKQISDNQHEIEELPKSEIISKTQSANTGIQYESLQNNLDCNETCKKHFWKSKIPKLKAHFISSLKEKKKAQDEPEQCTRGVLPPKKQFSKANKHITVTNHRHRLPEVTRFTNKKVNTHHNDTKPELLRQHDASLVREEKNITHNGKIKLRPIGRSNIDRQDVTNIENAKVLYNPTNMIPAPNHCYMRSLRRATPLPGLKYTVKKSSFQQQCSNIFQHNQDRQIDIPRPQNLKITRRVGIDGAVIAWSPMESDGIAGFQVILDGRVIQQVRSPKRTKALVNGLPFRDGFTISLSTISTGGRCSIPVTVTHKKSQIVKRKDQRDNYKCTKTTFKCFSP